jgi:hypothetical protein
LCGVLKKGAAFFCPERIPTMIIDTRTQFCDGTALNTGAAGVYALGDVIDLQATGLDIGQGAAVSLVIMVSEDATSGGAATASFSLVSDSTATLATDGSASVHVTSATFAVAAMTAGTVVASIDLPTGSYERYVGLVQTTGGAAFTGGAVKAILPIAPSSWKAYADAV